MTDGDVVVAGKRMSADEKLKSKRRRGTDVDRVAGTAEQREDVHSYATWLKLVALHFHNYILVLHLHLLSLCLTAWARRKSHTDPQNHRASEVDGCNVLPASSERQHQARRRQTTDEREPI